MNYRTILLATAAVMFAGAANAEDITAPMYLPGAERYCQTLPCSMSAPR